MMFAQLPDPNHFSSIGWILVGLAALALCANQVHDFVQRWRGTDNTRQISPQPLAVEITKTLHEQFAAKIEVEKLKEHTTQRHVQIFASIDRVEREARQNLDDRFNELNEERRLTLEKLNEQFMLIRENLGALQTASEINTRATSDLSAKLDRQLAETISTIINAKRV